ncbi:MAG: Cytidylate kinase [Myxococcota bacterium]|nr:Cytidylate kinase [Myxococcota bacterium]
MNQTALPEDWIIAIDGPVGSGKSTIARLLARRIGFRHIDTGAIYRSLALHALRHGAPWDDGDALGALAAGLPMEFAAREEGNAVLLEGRDVSLDIRTPEISRGASLVSKWPQVRAALVDLQRRLGGNGSAVLEGRDIGTVIFPDAAAKFFLDARPEVRARRRHAELAAKGAAPPFEEVLRDLIERDERDRTREAAPLKPAPGAMIVDTSDLATEQVLEELIRLLRDKARGT